jgi:hypothetical protein
MPPHHATRWRLSAFEALAKRLELKIERVGYEPLLLENHSYYSAHWITRKFPGQSPAERVARFASSTCFKVFFELLRLLGVRYFAPLKGQSLYVLMSLPRG